MLYILLENKNEIIPFVINTTITYIIKALLFSTLLLLLIKETYNLLYLHLLKLSHERLTVMLITKNAHIMLNPTQNLLHRNCWYIKYMHFLYFKMAFNTVYSPYNNMFSKKVVKHYFAMCCFELLVLSSRNINTTKSIFYFEKLRSFWILSKLLINYILRIQRGSIYESFKTSSISYICYTLFHIIFLS